MPPEDRVRLQHMIEAAEAVLQLTDNRARDDLNGNLMLRLALVRAIEVLGEAASRVTAQTRTATPTIPWSAIVGMRHRLSHAYYDIDYDVVWRTATAEIPPLLFVLRAVLTAST